MDSKKFYVYNQQALDAGSRADRVFLVTREYESYADGWTCQVDHQGLYHPGYEQPLSVAQLRTGEGRNRWYGRYSSQRLPLNELLEVDVDYVQGMIENKEDLTIVRAEASQGESRGLTFHHGLASMVEFKRHFPDSAGGLKVVAINPVALDDHTVVLFEGNLDIAALSSFIRTHAYVNSWTITIVPFEA